VNRHASHKRATVFKENLASILLEVGQPRRGGLGAIQSIFQVGIFLFFQTAGEAWLEMTKTFSNNSAQRVLALCCGAANEEQQCNSHILTRAR
jgi:hypothetical protein